MSKADYQKIIYGATIGALTFLLLFYMLKLNEPAKVLEPKGNFEVVDTYRGCDVVRYTNDSMATYKYFLDCTDSMRNK
jgi:hypothetical protein